jgi:hypothetical protein
MRAVVLVLALAIFNSGAWASEWTLVRGNTEPGEKTYIDKSSLARKGTLAKMWSLVNHERPKAVAGREHLSEKSLVQYDCKTGQSRKMEFHWYSRHDGEGELIYSDRDPGTMLPMIPGSAGESAWKIACESE